LSFTLCYNEFVKRIIVIMFLLFPALAYAQPSIKFATEKFDFGDVKQGTQLAYTFEFENAGKEDLIIGRLVPS